MDRIQKQSILLVIETLEGQLQALRSLIGLTSGGQPDYLVKRKGGDDTHYTSDEDDKLIEEALKVEAEKDELLQNIFQQASDSPEG